MKVQNTYLEDSLYEKQIFMFVFADHEISDNEISSHRHHYVGFHIPSKNKKTHGQTGDRSHRKSSVASRGHPRNKHLKLPKEDLRPGTTHRKYIYLQMLIDISVKEDVSYCPGKINI